MKLLNQTIMTKLGSATLIGYILDNYERVDPNRRRPAIIFCPGGGFNHLSDREGEPLAVRMLTHGFQAFVLKYSLKPKCFPAALSELAESVKCLRDHAEELHIARMRSSLQEPPPARMSRQASGSMPTAS